MSSNQHSDDEHIQKLIENVLNHNLTLEDASELNRILPTNEQARYDFIEMHLLSDELSKLVTPASVIKSVTASTFPPEKSNWKKHLALISGIAAAITFAFILLHTPAPTYTIVNSTIPNKKFSTDHEIKNGTRLTFDTGVLELRSSNGSLITIAGPANLSLLEDQTINLSLGKLFIDSQGNDINVRTPSGSIDNIGTIYGIEQTSNGSSRVDVFDGSVSLNQKSRSPQHLQNGNAAIFNKTTWPPIIRDADRSRYIASLSAPIGINFKHPDAPPITGTPPFGATWSEATTAEGSLQPKGTSFKIEWLSESIHNRKGAASAELRPYVNHLRGYTSTRRNNHPLAQDMKLDHNMLGAVIRLSDMNQWMKQIGATSYQITILRAASFPTHTFLPTLIYQSPHATGTPLEFPITSTSPSKLPESQAGGRTASQKINQTFTSDTLIITTTPQNRIKTTPRANICAILITPICD